MARGVDREILPEDRMRRLCRIYHTARDAAAAAQVAPTSITRRCLELIRETGDTEAFTFRMNVSMAYDDRTTARYLEK